MREATCLSFTASLLSLLLAPPALPSPSYIRYIWASVCPSVKWRNCWPLSCVQLFPTLWTVALQTPLSMGFPRPEYWSGLPISFSRGSSQPRDRTQFLLHCRWVLCSLSHPPKGKWGKRTFNFLPCFSTPFKEGLNGRG